MQVADCFYQECDHMVNMHMLRLLLRLTKASQSTPFTYCRSVNLTRHISSEVTATENGEVVSPSDLSTEDEMSSLESTPLDQSILPQYGFRDKKKQLAQQADLLTQTVFPSFEPKSIMRRLERRPEKIDPWATTLIFFPGEGNYFIGMGDRLSDYPNVLEMFEVASRIMQVNLIDICFNGPIEKLASISDEAIYVCSLAAAEKLRYERPTAIHSCVGVAGSSIGEITALVFAGALSFEDGLRLIQIRNKAISLVNSKVPSALYNIVYSADARLQLGLRAAQEYISRLGVEPEEAHCSVAYYLFPHCKIIGGHEKALEFIRANGKDFGVRRIKPVTNYGSNGRGALHTQIMSPVENTMRKAAVRMPLAVPKVPVYSGTDHKAYHSVEAIVEKLPRVVSKPVKMEQIIRNLYYSSKETHLPYSFELGPGRSMSDLLEKVNSRARRQMTPIFA